MPEPKDKWLTNAEAAEALAVDARTIKRWMRCRAKRDALLAIRHGKQWRIPRPDNLILWDMETRDRLEKLGIQLKEPWERELEQHGKEYDRYRLESYRLWLAAYLKVLERDRVTPE